MLANLTDVLDEGDVASELETREREASVQRILSSMKKVDEKDIITDPDLTCIQCRTIIPEARQKIVISMYGECEYCVKCQEKMDKRERLYAQL